MLAIAFALLTIDADLREFRKLPPEAICEKNYNEAADWERKAWKAYQDDERTNKADLWATTLGDFARCREFWWSAWCVTCSNEKHPTWTWDLRLEHLLRCRAIVGVERWGTLGPWRPEAKP